MVPSYTGNYMLGDNNKHISKRQSQSLDGFMNNIPGGQGRKIITPFVSRKQASGLQRRVDDFSRTEGYRPLTPRQLGVPLPGAKPVAEPELVIAPPAPTEADEPTINETNSNKRNRKHSKKRGKLSKLIKASLIVLVLLVVITSGFLITKGYLQLKHIFRGGANHDAALTVNVNPSELSGEGAGRINILILGIGGQGHDGPDLTDTMLVASIDPVNKKAALLSVPRDMWIKMPNNYMGNYQKINAAYESGKYSYLNKEDSSNNNQNAVDAGFKTADQAVNQVLGITINYNVLVDFQAFEQAVNTVGGVTVDVPTELYDPTMAWENGGNPVLASPGIQVMNGNQALNYVRSRETTSDFARTQRQRAVIVALKDKALSLGVLSDPFKLSSLMSAFGENIQTDISLSDATAIYNLTKSIDNSNIQSIGLADPPNNFVTTADVDGLSVVEPRAGEFDYTQIQSYVRSVLVDGYLTKENASVTILNGTSTPGLATSLANTLKSYGYNVGTVASAPTLNYTQTVLVDLTNGKDKYTRNYLQERLGVQAVDSLPDKTIQPNGADFVIIIGQNEANAVQ